VRSIQENEDFSKLFGSINVHQSTHGRPHVTVQQLKVPPFLGFLINVRIKSLILPGRRKKAIHSHLTHLTPSNRRRRTFGFCR